MTNPAWLRLVELYQNGLLRLLPAAALERPELLETPEFREAAWRVASNMVQGVAKANATSWRQAAMKSTNARRIYLGLQREIAEGKLGPELHQLAVRNAQLISILPGDIARRITAHAEVLTQRGARPEEIARELRRVVPTMAKSRMRLIARTEVSRAETDLTRLRSQRIGIEWYQWSSSRDQRVRPSHRNMDQVLVAWDDAPQPEELIGQRSTLGYGHAGQFPNCRCDCLPVADLDEIRWPARAYSNGRIVRMSRAQFMRLSGLEMAA